MEERQDLISRQAAIDRMINSKSNADVTLVPGSYTNGWRDGRKLLLDELLQVVFELPSAQPENQVHLCDSCRYVYPECPSGKGDVIFGNGKGNDNICACNKYEPSSQPEIIRCRDCKKCLIDNIYHDYWCDGRKVWRDHYCGYAERKNADGN